MDLHTVKVRLQEHLSDGLVTIVGSGLSCAEGLPGMGELANYLLAEIGGGLTGPDAAAWTAVSPLVKTKGLEAAISAATGKLISERERTVISEVFAGKRKLRLTRLLAHRQQQIRWNDAEWN
jgi:hypothetical protein